VTTVTGGASLWLRSVRAVLWRGNLRTLRFPGLLFVVSFFPIFFLVAYSGLFPRLTDVPGFPTDTFENWLVPFSVLQGAAFSGLGAGFMSGSDIDSGFMDRLLLMPARRSAIYLGSVLMAVVRALLVGLPVFVIGLLLGAELNGGVAGFLLLGVAVAGTSLISASFALGVIYRIQDQRVAPLFQIVIFVGLFTSTAQVPLAVATGWLHDVASVNPITQVLRLARQSTLESGVTWSDTWPGLVALAVGVGALGWFALRGLRRLVP
jgi:ABC-type multidrug transport system permease subunit